MMKKLREKNKKRAQRIKDGKEKQLKIIRDEKIEKQRKIQRDAGSKGDPKISEGGRFVNLEITFPKTG